MKINLIIGQYSQTYPGEYMPNIMDSWDEYVVEENPSGYSDSLAIWRKELGVDNVKEMVIEIPDAEITGLWDVATGHVNIISRDQSPLDVDEVV